MSLLLPIMAAFILSGLSPLSAAGAEQSPKTGFVVATVSVAADVEPEAVGWFGVRLEPPAPALDRQLKLDGRGLVISNICKDSPAERSGLNQYDVVLRFAGQPVKSDFDDLAGTIRKLGPGADVALVVIRQGEELELQATLDAWPDQGPLEWQYDEPPQVVFTDMFDVAGKILRHGPGGEVIVEDLELPAIPDEFRVVLPQMGRKSLEIWQEDGRAKLRCVAVKDDTTYHIEQDADGRIQVRRVTRHDDAEQVSEHSYDDEAALREGDLEAYRILKDPETQHLHAHVVLQPDNAEAAAKRPPPLKWTPPPQPGEPNDPQQLQEWREAMHKALKEMNVAALRKLHQPSAESRALLLQPPPRFSFTVDYEGRITATIRKGEVELTKSYRDVQQLEEKDPALYERYTELAASD